MFTLLGPKIPKIKNNFKICSYIQESTTSTINAFKIAIYDTKHTTNAKIHLKFSEIFEILKTFKLLFCYIYNFNNSYFVYFVNLIYFVYFVKNKLGKAGSA